MKPFIPREKLSKKARKELDRKQRQTWGSINPITRKIENAKIYNRKKVQKGDDETLPFEPFVIFGWQKIRIISKKRDAVLNAPLF